MPNGNQITANAADGTQHIFPAGTDMAIVDGVMKKYASERQAVQQPGAFQQRPGGPVMNAKNLDSGNGEDASPTPGSMAREATLGAFSGLGVPETQNPVRDALKGLLESFGTMMGGKAWQGQDPHGIEALKATPPVAIARGAYGGLEDIYGGGVRGGISPDANKVSHGVGTLLGTAGSAGLLKKAPEVAESVSDIPKIPRATLQKLAGVGPELTEKAISDRQASIDEAGQKYQGKVEAIKQANQQAKEAALQKQQLSDEVSGHAKELSERLPKLKEQERAFAKSMYPEIEGTADSGDVYSKMSDAVDSNLRGTGRVPTALKKVIDDLAPEDVKRSTGPQVGGRHLDLSNPDDLRAFQRFKKAGVFAPDEVERMEGQSAKGSLDFETLHGYYSELGEALGKDMPGDERSALMQGRSALAETMRKMAEADKKLGPFQDAQKNWGKYENTFNKTWNDGKGMASPIAKALNAKDPVNGQILPEKLQQILGNDKSYKLAQQMLGRYKGGPTDVLQLMKEKADQAGTLPKNFREKPLPSSPLEPPQVDPRATKAAALKKIAEGSTISKPSRFEMWFPPLLVKRRLEGAIFNNQKLQDWLSTPREADLAKLKPSQVYPTAKAAAEAATKTGYKPSEKASTMSAAPRDLGPEFNAGEREHEIQRNKSIIRNPRATPEEIAIAKARLKEAQ